MEKLSVNICRYLSASHLPPSHLTLKVSLESRLSHKLSWDWRIGWCANPPCLSLARPTQPPACKDFWMSLYLCPASAPEHSCSHKILEDGEKRAAIMSCKNAKSLKLCSASDGCKVPKTVWVQFGYIQSPMCS